MGGIIKTVRKPVVTILITLAIGAVLIINTGESPLYAYGILFYGAFGSVTGILNTLAKATPLIFTGLAASLASIAGIFNIGIEGQIYFGALASAVTAIALDGLPGVIVIPVSMIAAMAAAVVWAMIPGILNYKLKINIFIMFFMMNNMATLFTEYLANTVFKGNITEAATDKVPKAARFTKFSVYSDLNTGFFLALILVIVLWFVLKKTRLGYEWYALGKNRTFSEYIGLHAGRMALGVLAISAMISGLAGTEQVLGNLGRFYANFSNDLGFTGISIGLLASNNPIGVLIFAIFFGALNSGGILMSAGTSVPSDLIQVLQSLMILMVSADFMITNWKKKPEKEAA